MFVLAILVPDGLMKEMCEMCIAETGNQAEIGVVYHTSLKGTVGMQIIF